MERLQKKVTIATALTLIGVGGPHLAGCYDGSRVDNRHHLPAVAAWMESNRTMTSQIRERRRPSCVTVLQVVARSGPALDELERRPTVASKEMALSIQETVQYAEALLIVEDGCR